MKRSLFLSLLIGTALFATQGRGDAQTFVRRPNGQMVPNRSHYQPYDITRFSARPVYPTRFHASPVYPQTMFWSNAYPNSPGIQGAIDAYNAQNAPSGTSPGYSGPAYYPWNDMPYTNGQLGPQPR